MKFIFSFEIIKNDTNLLQTLLHLTKFLIKIVKKKYSLNNFQQQTNKTKIASNSNLNLLKQIK